MAIEVFVADEQSDHPVDSLRWVKLAEAVLAAEGVRGDAELSLLFVDEQAMADLHKRFLDKEGSTDVLAFPIDDDPTESGRSPDSGGTGPGYAPGEPAEVPLLVGDVVICPAVADRNALENAGTYDDEVALLVVHGILHLMGMDHLEEEEATVMEQREQELLAQLYRGERPAASASSSGGADAPATLPTPEAEPTLPPDEGEG